MDGGARTGHADLLAAAPCHRPDVAVADALSGDEFERRPVQLGDGEGDAEAQFTRRVVQPLRVLGQFEDVTVVDAFPFEDAAAVVETMGEHVQAGVAPGDEPAVQPDVPVTVVESRSGHCAPSTGAYAMRTICSMVPWNASASSVEGWWDRTNAG